jgi:ABC-2 type transport system ATP-binding protein
VFGRHVLVYDGRDTADLEALGELRTPSIADLFVACMQAPNTAAQTGVRQ